MSAEDDRKQELNDIRTVLSTEQGQRFVQRLIDRSGLYVPTYGSGSEISDFAFMEGRREFGLFILGEITQADHKTWLNMQRKQFEKIDGVNDGRK